jgi:DnaJ-class molecular chaperone
MKTCHHCSGGGSVDAEYTDSEGEGHVVTIECPLCDGSGEVSTGEPSSEEVAG